MPSAPRIWLDYRSVRIGWVIPDRDIARLATAAAWNSCLWGGRFNPIIPIHDITLADQLVKTFAVDILLPVDGTDATRTFIDRFPYLLHDRWRETIFQQRRCEFADIRHVVRHIFRNQDKQAESALILPVWDLADVLQRSCAWCAEARKLLDASSNCAGRNLATGPRPYRYSCCVCRKRRPFDLMTESLNVGRDGRADISVLEPGCLALQAQKPA